MVKACLPPKLLKYCAREGMVCTYNHCVWQPLAGEVCQPVKRINRHWQLLVIRYILYEHFHICPIYSIVFLLQYLVQFTKFQFNFPSINKKNCKLKTLN